MNTKILSERPRIESYIELAQSLFPKDFSANSVVKEDARSGLVAVGGHCEEIREWDQGRQYTMLETPQDILTGYRLKVLILDTKNAANSQTPVRMILHSDRSSQGPFLGSISTDSENIYIQLRTNTIVNPNRLYRLPIADLWSRYTHFLTDFALF